MLYAFNIIVRFVTGCRKLGLRAEELKTR